MCCCCAGVQRHQLDEVFNGRPAVSVIKDSNFSLGKSRLFSTVGVFVVVGFEISSGPNHAIAQNKKQAVGPKKAQGYLVVVNGVIDRQVQLAEERFRAPGCNRRCDIGPQ